LARRWEGSGRRDKHSALAMVTLKGLWHPKEDYPITVKPGLKGEGLATDTTLRHI
jgi:hypothetical protein